MKNQLLEDYFYKIQEQNYYKKIEEKKFWLYIKNCLKGGWEKFLETV